MKEASVGVVVREPPAASGNVPNTSGAILRNGGSSWSMQSLLYDGAHLCAFTQPCVSVCTGCHVCLVQPERDFRVSASQNLQVECN